MPTPAEQAALIREHTDGFDVRDEEDTPLEPRVSAPVVGSAPPAGTGTPGGAAAPAKPQHPATLLAMARQLGFSAEDIASTPTAELRADVELLARIQREGQTAAATRQQPVTVTTSQPAAPPPPPPSLLGQHKGKFDPEFEAALEGVLEGIVKPLQDELATTKKQLGEFGGEVQATRQQSQTERVDAAFAALGKRFEKVYGAGSGLDMQRDDPNWKRRNTALMVARIDFNKPLPPVAEIVRRLQEATVETYGPMLRENAPAPQPAAQPKPAPVQSGYAGADQPQQPAAPAAYTPHPRRPPMPAPVISPITGQFQAEPDPLVTQWEGAILGTPTNRESPMPTGRDRAIQGVTQVFQEHGVDERQQEQAEREGFL